jgi:thiol-disulfide isomerase/thioredoxin
MENKPGIKFLVQINSLAKLFNDVIKINDYNGAYNLIYKMRIIHGKLLMDLSKYTDQSDETFFNISCMNSILYVINEKIIESELLFNKIISKNQIDVSTLKISKSDNSLPLFNGSKSVSVMIGDEIKSVSVDSFNEKIPSLLFFFNPHCPACVKTKPHWTETIGNIKKMFAQDIVLFNIMEINLSEPANEKLARLFKIEYIPTIIMMEPSNKPQAIIEKIEGAADKNKIQKFIKDSFNKFMNK